MEIKKALEELRKEKERKFNQTIDLIVNLKGIDVKKTTITAVVDVPNNIKEKKVCGFFNDKSNVVDTITKVNFAKYKEKTALKNLVKKYDFFIAIPALMPAVATTFGKVLGPAGKMPSPQLGIIPNSEDAVVKKVLDKISRSVKIRAKEPSIKLSIAKINMKDEEILENFNVIYNGIVNALPNKKENVRNVIIKTTMGKPLRVEVK